MTNLQIKGSWNEVKGKLKQKYGQLTDDDLSFAVGEGDEFLGRLQRRLGKSKEDLRAEIETVAGGFSGFDVGFGFNQPPGAKGAACR